MLRTIALAIALFLTISGCSLSKDRVQQALDDAQQGLEIADKSLKVTGDLYERYCALRPACKACKGEAADQIRTLLAMRPLTVGQIQDLLNKIQ